MAARKATGGARNKLAVILSGNAARAAAHLGALQALEESGMAPALVVGVSGGAVAGALYCATGDAALARDQLYDLVAKHSWQDLADIDFDALRDLLARPYEVSGFLKGDALIQALLATAIGHKGFSDLATELFVLACDLNSGREVVFCAQNQEELGDEPPYRVYARTADDLVRVNVAAACRASCATPGIFRPLSVEHLCLVDGSLRLRRAVAVAAAQSGVKRILWLHAGLDENDQFSLVTDYAGQSFGAGISHAVTIASADQFDPHTGDPALDGIAVRYVNLAVSSIGSAELTKAQQLSESGRRTLAAILAKEPCGGGKGFFEGDVAAIEAALEADVDEVDGPRWSVTVGQGGRDVLAVVDLMPPVQQEFGYEFDEYLQSIEAPRIEPREPVATATWSQDLAERQLGVARLAGMSLSQFLGYAVRGAALGAKTAWTALSLDTAWNKLTDAVGQGALKVSDVLFPNGDAKDDDAPTADEQGADAEPETADAGELEDPSAASEDDT